MVRPLHALWLTPISIKRPETRDLEARYPAPQRFRRVFTDCRTCAGRWAVLLIDGRTAGIGSPLSVDTMFLRAASGSARMSSV